MLGIEDSFHFRFPIIINNIRVKISKAVSLQVLLIIYLRYIHRSGNVEKTRMSALQAIGVIHIFMSSPTLENIIFNDLHQSYRLKINVVPHLICIF